MINQDFSLYEMFLQDTKDSLVRNARHLGLKVNSKEKKTVIAARFAKTILQNPLYLLKTLPFQDVLKIQAMVHAKDHAIVNHEGLFFCSMEEIGLTDLVFRKNRPMLFLYPDLVDSLKPVIDKYVESVDLNSGKVWNEQIAIGLIHLYGILTYTDFLELCRKADSGLTAEVMNQTIESSYYLMRSLDNKIYPPTFVSPFVFNYESLRNALDFRRSINYASFTTGQILAAGDPDFPLPPETEAIRSFRAICHKLQIGSTTRGEEAEAEINRKISMNWMLQNNERDPGDLIQNILKNNDLDLPAIKELVTRIFEMGNHFPTWILKGNSPRSVFEKSERDQFLKKPPELVMGPGAIRAGHHIPQEAFNKAWEKNVPKQSQKVGRNDPCPCGSGRKYKQCCLSEMNGFTA